jgi:hypothetical protein
MSTETEIDVELRSLKGPAISEAVGANLDKRGPGKAGTSDVLARQAAPAADPRGDRPGALTWEDLQQRNAEWSGQFWAECRALYSGGPRLLGDAKVLERLFPKHMHEDAAVYEARKSRAHYYPYAGTICEELLAGLAADPLRVSFGEMDDKGDQAGDDWWTPFVSDVTGESDKIPGEDDNGEGGCSMHHFSVDMVREMLQTRFTWVLADLPLAPIDAPPTSALDEDKEGLTDPYLCLVPAEQIVDWEYDDQGNLLWAMHLTERQLRLSPTDRRDKLTATYTLWLPTGWAKYVVVYDPKQPPVKETKYEPADWGPHPFKRVPLERVELAEGMWAMGKLHSLAREHFNKRCAASWAEYKALFAVLYEFLGPEEGAMPIAEAQQDPDRAIAQTRGQGYTQTRGKDDDARYVGPDVAPFTEARESCAEVMREMHRVMYSMAQSADMGKQALARSGESKSQDKAATEVILMAFGQVVRRAVRRLLGLIALGRSEVVPPCQVHGQEKFDATSLADAISQAVELFNGLPIASITFAHMALLRLYLQYLGDSVTDQQRDEIRTQIEQVVTAESLAQGMLVTAGAAATVRAKGEVDASNKDAGDGEPDGDEEDGAAGGGAKGGKAGGKPPQRPIRTLPRRGGKGKR